MFFLIVVITLVICSVSLFFHIKKLNKRFKDKADVLEKKMISGYNMYLASQEFKTLRRIAFTRENRERLYLLRRLFVITYGQFIVD